MVVFIRRYIIQLLVLAIAGIFLAAFQIPDSDLHIIACDVGQGDAILVTYKNTQIVTDGGPGGGVIDCLSKYMPFWDREIELLILTHPDADHSTGVVDIIKRYNIGTFLTSDVEVSTSVAEALEKEVGSRGINAIKGYGGMRLKVGMIQLDILHPPQGYQNTKTNEHSIVYLLDFKDFEAVFSGDIEDDVSDALAANFTPEKVEYIKVPHHGSKNGLSEDLLKVLMPEIAVISVGKNNIYKHPHQEVLDLLNSYGLRILRTDLMGDIMLSTDGESFWIK